MTSRNRRHIAHALYGLSISIFGVFVLCGAPRVMATDDAFTLTVAPPLFQLALQPGESWRSGIQVVNSNAYDITVFADPVLFRPKGDSGQPEFYTSGNEDGTLDSGTLAGWITVPQGPIVIPQEQTYVVPLTITVPANAPPGGHYAAVLIGNRPSSGTPEGGSLSVTSSIASLVLLRVAGDVVEDGRIREFSTEQSVYEDAEAHFQLRFENQGNVHLLPQGDITIYNMFGKVRGYVPINQKRDDHGNSIGNQDTGNVLPGSTRKYSFSWKSDTGSWDIGRYRAVATVGFGAESKQFVNASVYFYVLPIIPLLQVIVGMAFGIFFIGWSLKSYIRRALYIEGIRQQGVVTHTEPVKSNSTSDKEPRMTLSTFIRPIQAGIVDLRSVGSAPQNIPSRDDGAFQKEKVHKEYTTRATLSAFLREYRTFFVFIIVASIGWVAASAYFTDVLTYERTYEITVTEDGAVGQNTNE